MRLPFNGWIAALAVMLTPLADVAEADDYPNRPIRFIAPIPAGGGTDVLARNIARLIQERWGQPAVVENKPGSAGGIGAAPVARAPGDGHKLPLANVRHVINGQEEMAQHAPARAWPVAASKVPARVWIVDAFPATHGTSGDKAQRSMLREMAAERLAAPGG